MEKKATAKPQGLSNSLKYLFGVGDAGFVLMSNIETFYFMTCMTDYLLFSPVMAGFINSVFSIVDACLSWIYGAILNGTKAKKWGRYRSWLILTPWIVPFIFAFQFLRIGSNEVLSATIIIIAAIVSHIVWNIGYVANGTMVSVVGKTAEERATIGSSRATWNNIGGLAFSYVGLPFAAWLGGIIGTKNQFAAAAFCLGILMALGYFAHFKMTAGYEDSEESDARAAMANKATIGEMFRALFQNPQLIIVIIADLAKWCVNFVTAASAIYFFRDAHGAPAMMATYLLLTNLGGICGAYCGRYVAAKLSNRTAIIITYCGMALFLFMIYVCYANMWLCIILMVFAKFFYGMALGITPAVYADTVVYATHRTGKNAAGWIMGLQNVPLKVAIFLRGVVISACLVAVGWQTGVVLEGTARQGMTVALGLVPACFCVLGAVLMITCYKLTREKVIALQAEIDARD